MVSIHFMLLTLLAIFTGPALGTGRTNHGRVGRKPVILVVMIISAVLTALVIVVERGVGLMILAGLMGTVMFSVNALTGGGPGPGGPASASGRSDRDDPAGRRRRRQHWRRRRHRQVPAPAWSLPGGQPGAHGPGVPGGGYRTHGEPGGLRVPAAGPGVCLRHRPWEHRHPRGVILAPAGGQRPVPAFPGAARHGHLAPPLQRHCGRYHRPAHRRRAAAHHIVADGASGGDVPHAGHRAAAVGLPLERGRSEGADGGGEGARVRRPDRRLRQAAPGARAARC